jgi:hypothetical protein
MNLSETHVTCPTVGPTRIALPDASFRALRWDRSLGGSGLGRTWERMERERRGKIERGLFSFAFCTLDVHGCFMSSVTAPVWGIKHTQAASGGFHSAWGYAEGKSDIGLET